MKLSSTSTEICNKIKYAEDMQKEMNGDIYDRR